MKEKLFAELMESAEDVLEHAKGKRELRTTVLPPEPRPVTTTEIKRLRTQLKASQSVFAHYVNVSTKLVQAWRRGCAGLMGRHCCYSGSWSGRRRNT